MADDKDLAFPRVMYRGAPDTLGTGTVGETQRVEDQDGYDEAVKQGWRKDRHDDKHPDKTKTAESDSGRGTITIPAQKVQALTDVDAGTPAPKVDETDKIAGEKARAAEKSGTPAKADKNAGAIAAPAKNSLKK